MNLRHESDVLPRCVQYVVQRGSTEALTEFRLSSRLGGLPSHGSTREQIYGRLPQFKTFRKEVCRKRSHTRTIALEACSPDCHDVLYTGPRESDTTEVFQ